MQTELEHVAIGSAPSWVIEPSIAINKESASLYLHSEKQIHFESKQNYLRHVIQFNTIEAIQNHSVLEFAINPHSEIVWHRLILTRGEEKINKLLTANMKCIQKESESHKYIYTGEWTFVIFLDDIREGDILDYSYTYNYSSRDNSPFNQDIFYLQFDCPVDSMYCRLIASPIRTKLKYHYCDVEPKIRSLENGFQEWVWHIYQSVPNLYEPNQPSWFCPASRIMISSFPDWDAVAVDAASIFQSNSELTSSMENQLDVWVKSYPDEKDLITAIIRFVQREIRYLSLDVGRIQDDVPHCPSEVFSKRYGDCKDKTLLLNVLLKAVGIRSYPSLVNTRLKDKIIDVLPGYAFNHAILAIEYKGKFFWIDPTSSYQNGSFECNTVDFEYALIIGKPGVSLVKIENDEMKGKVVCSIEFDLRNKTSANLKVTTTFLNSQAESFRERFSHSKYADLNERYLKYYKNFYPTISQVSAVNIEELTEGNALRIYEWYLIIDAEEKIHPFSVREAISGVLLLDDRKTIFALNDIDVQEEIIIKYYENIDHQSKEMDLSNEYIRYTEKWDRLQENTYRVAYSIKSLKNYVPPDFFSQMRDFIDEVSTRGILINAKEESKPVVATEKRSFWSKMLLVFFAINIIRVLFLLFSKLKSGL